MFVLTNLVSISFSLKQVTKTVYASPSRVNFHLDRRKVGFCILHRTLEEAVFKVLIGACIFGQAVETVPAYPNIFFSVDDFDDTFDSVVRFCAIV